MIPFPAKEIKTKEELLEAIRDQITALEMLADSIESDGDLWDFAKLDCGVSAIEYVASAINPNSH